MDLVKKLTGNNPKDYEFAAARIIDNADVEAFKDLVSKDDFLFDFIKNNVAKRLKKACNENNYKNLLAFLPYYSPFYDDVIAKVLSQYSDEALIEVMLSKFQIGTNEEKAYCAKFFSYCIDDRALGYLRVNAYSDFESLAFNSAVALSVINDRVSVDLAMIKLASEDEFESFSAVKFLSAFQERDAIPKLFEVMKKSSLSEYIACEIGYIEPLISLLESEFKSYSLLAILNILHGLGEIIPLSQVFAFQFFEIFEKLIFAEPNSENAVVLLAAREKFNQLTENDEYLYDEDKNTKNEVNEICKLLNDNLPEELDDLIKAELNDDSLLLMYAIDLIKNPENLVPLLNSSNQTVILKVMEVLKIFDKLGNVNKEDVLLKISDDNIKSIITAM